MRLLLLVIAVTCGGAMAQTIESRSVTLNGTSLPASCVVSERFFKTDATAGQNLYLCTSTNTWTQVSGGSGVSDPSALGCGVTRTSATVLTVFAEASGSVPCIIGGTRFTAPATLTTSGTAATGTYYLEVRAGVIYGRLPGATTGLTPSGLTLEASSASFSATSIRLWTWDKAVAGTWDAGVGTDQRSWLTTQIVPAAGQLMTSSDSGGTRTLNVDSQGLYLNDRCRSTTGNDTYTCGTTPATAAYSNDRCYVLNADTANTGAATINIDSLGAKSILRRNGDALSDGDITANKPITICYDGTQMIIQGDGGGSSTSWNSGYEWIANDNTLVRNGTTVLGTVPTVFHMPPLGQPMTVTKAVVNIEVGLTSGEGFVISVLEPGCGTEIGVSAVRTSTATGEAILAFSPGLNLLTKSYCVMMTTDSTTLSISQHASSATWNSMKVILNAGVTRVGGCGAYSGSGGSLDPPSSCTPNTGTGANAAFNVALMQ